MINSEIFSKKLMEDDILMERTQDEDGVYFRVRQTLDYGNDVVVAVFFTNSESIVDINIFNIVQINNPAKKAELHSLLNEFNEKFRYIKFIDFDGHVAAQYSYNIEDHFNPQAVINYIGLFLNAAEKVYPALIELKKA
ncbi:YbjN domain-containing protein [Sporosarcina pasteurii]|uniref:Sensory transduction regulator n=1 Tax=Sporosarcina pasteurii TaxID=1474 RepID=A0A380BDX0_SPOPA|nr:YbjN domain-containing protein [Sporosarcina pasteurii]MDS9472197.1 YbjN domain-containing protein [Sporosarcina pasteurii]QBQ06185.1 YbjN domain-containing protein [Sporosarcina pasteurii]SUI99210.1 Uncharacterised protein [Sporosarcina pasteurii]